MKKLFILLFVLLSVTSYSQIDTIHSWERIPGVYYEDTNWWDHYSFNVPCEYEDLEVNTVQYIAIGGNRSETARLLFSDTTLKVIGIAASVAFSVDDNTIDTALSHRPPEYFRLYKADSSGLEKLRDVRWDTATVRKRNSVGIWKTYKPNLNTYQVEVVYEEDIMDLYEAYFETPALVKDSFYVSGTTYGNYKIADTVVIEIPNYGEHVTVYYRHAFPTSVYFASRFARFLPKVERYAPRNNIFRDRVLSQDTTQPDGVWRINEGSDYYINIFPIIDTTFFGTVADMDTCVVPQGLGVGYLNKDSVTLEWDYVSELYELSVTRDDGTLPEDDTIYSCTSTFKVLTGLDTATWYVARVRSVCDNGLESEWSDSVRFYVPGDTCTNNGDGGYPERIGNALEQLTSLMPNPARDKVTVLSSFRIGKVVVFDAAGNKVFQVEPNDMSMTIDLSPLPSGVYIVSIVTNRGTVHKRLVKE